MRKRTCVRILLVVGIVACRGANSGSAAQDRRQALPADAVVSITESQVPGSWVTEYAVSPSVSNDKTEYRRRTVFTFRKDGTGQVERFGVTYSDYISSRTGGVLEKAESEMAAELTWVFSRATEDEGPRVDYRIARVLKGEKYTPGDRLFVRLLRYREPQVAFMDSESTFEDLEKPWTRYLSPEDSFRAFIDQVKARNTQAASRYAVRFADIDDVSTVKYFCETWFRPYIDSYKIAAKLDYDNITVFLIDADGTQFPLSLVLQAGVWRFYPPERLMGGLPLGFQRDGQYKEIMNWLANTMNKSEFERWKSMTGR